MTTCTIKKVEPALGLIPRLQFTTNLRFDAGQAHERLFLAKWVGEISFTRTAEVGMQPLGPNKVVLPAKWASEADSSRALSHSDVAATFSCDLPPTILDSLESFRDGGRMFARVQGEFQVLFLDSYDASFEVVLTRLVEFLTNHQRVLWQRVWGDSIELTRDLWCTEILPRLRPPGRFVLEGSLPKTQAEEEHGRRALAHLMDADRAFDEGHYDEAARLVYKAGEALQQLGSAVEARYGELAQKAIARQNSALQALCHPERHDESKVNGGHDTDRAMAAHLITSMKSLASIYMVG